MSFQGATVPWDLPLFCLLPSLVPTYPPSTPQACKMTPACLLPDSVQVLKAQTPKHTSIPSLPGQARPCLPHP